MIAKRPNCSGPTLNELARMARLDLPVERLSVIGPAVNLLYGLVDQLDAVDLSDIPSAATFNPRWD